MKLFYGKEVFTTLEELVDPIHTALLIIDIQNDFCKVKDENGNISYSVSTYEPLIANVKQTINAAHEAGVLVVYLQHTTLPEFRNESPARILYRMHGKGVSDPYELKMFTLLGSWGWEVVEELTPQANDLRVQKPRSSGFVGTNLDILLKNSGIKTLAATGVVTQGCVESTVRDGLFHDYYIVIIEDCVGSGDFQAHTDSLNFMSKRFDMTTSNELISLWKSSII